MRNIDKLLALGKAYVHDIRDSKFGIIERHKNKIINIYIISYNLNYNTVYFQFDELSNIETVFFYIESNKNYNYKKLKLNFRRLKEQNEFNALNGKSVYIRSLHNDLF